ncbi:MAG: hypothetical protein HY459_02645 [Parcubacteria group bacterium]|nr:hypothetical protein [Parcubacteria group bacterium]
MESGFMRAPVALQSVDNILVYSTPQPSTEVTEAVEATLKTMVLSDRRLVVSKGNKVEQVVEARACLTTDDFGLIVVGTSSKKASCNDEYVARECSSLMQSLHEMHSIIRRGGTSWHRCVGLLAFLVDSSQQVHYHSEAVVSEAWSVAWLKARLKEGGGRRRRYLDE